MTSRSRSAVVPIFAIVLGVVLVGADALAGAPPLAIALGMGVILVYAAVIWVFQTRSETVSTLAGRPFDERWQLIHERALALSATIAAVASIAGYAIVRASGRDATEFLVMAVIIGLGYIGGLVWFRWRE